ncbi:MAG: hypothetical protein ACRBFS_23325 [Aureispira sp.]
MTMLKNLTLITVFFLIGIANSFSQASLTFNQTFSALKATTLELNVNSQNIHIKSTKGSRIIVEASVKISSSNYNLLEFMQNSGRYELEQQMDADRKVLILSTKRLKNVVVIKGEEIHETVNYTIYLPSTIKYAAKLLEG